MWTSILGHEPLTRSGIPLLLTLWDPRWFSLKSIDFLEQYILQTAVILVFLSADYFKSKNCLRELLCALDKMKHIALGHDSAECEPTPRACIAPRVSLAR